LAVAAKNFSFFWRPAKERRAFLALGKSFILDYTYNGLKPGIDERIIGMAANASGIRDAARALKVSKQNVCDTFKKRKKRQAGSTSGT